MVAPVHQLDQARDLGLELVALALQGADVAALHLVAVEDLAVQHGLPPAGFPEQGQLHQARCLVFHLVAFQRLRCNAQVARN